MINLKENIEVLEKIIVKYLITEDSEYRLYDDNNETVDRNKVLRNIQYNYFSNDIIGEVFTVIKNFNSEYAKMPNEEEIWQMLKIKNLEISKDEFNLIFGINVNKYTPDFFYKYLKTFVLINGLNGSLMNVLTEVKTKDVNPDNIDELFDYVRNNINEGLDVDITNEGMGLNIKDPKSHIQYTKQTKSTGFPFFDKVLGGGWEPKTFIVFQGRPKVGKSLVLANLAVRAAVKKYNVGLFTVELGDSKYVKRVGSNLYNVDYEDYSKFIDEGSIGPLTKIIADMEEKRPTGELWIKEYPTGAASPIDVENYFIKLQKMLGKKFDVIFVDYVNLLKPSNNDQTMYERIKKICEELRRIAIRNEWCVVSATQVKTSSFTTDDLQLDSTAESSGLLATVDSLFGIMGDPGDPVLKIKNIANRDEGHMDSYRKYLKVKTYFRLVEATGADTEYWSEDDGEDLIEQVKDQYNSLTHQNNEITTEVTATPVNNNDLKPNTDFENESETITKKETKEEQSIEEKSIVKNVIDIDHDSILETVK